MSDIKEIRDLETIKAQLDAEIARLEADKLNLAEVKSNINLTGAQMAAESAAASARRAEEASLAAEKANLAAEKAVKKSGGFLARAGSLLKGLIIGLLIGAVAMFFLSRSLTKKPHSSGDVASVNEDGIIEEHFGGYTAIDFKDAILGEAGEHQELIVMEQPIKYATTLTREGPWQWEVFRKTQTITYSGTGVYTVDLSGLKEENISVDEEDKTVKITVPHAILQYVNPNYEEIEFSDTEKGLLAFTEIKLTTEELNELYKTVEQEMTELLNEEEILNQADEIARVKVWDIFQPLVTSVSPKHKLEVAFGEEVKSNAEPGDTDSNSDSRADDGGAENMDEASSGTTESEGSVAITTENPIATGMELVVDDRVFSVTMEDNETVREFLTLLPIDITMKDLNTNGVYEKYYYMDEHLDIAPKVAGTIEKGDIKIFRDDCIVIFYETFSSNYSYTKLGKADDPDGLAQALGEGDVRVVIRPIS